MHFRIAHTFKHSLAKLTGNEQKAAKITVFDLHMNPVQPGLRQHRLDGARDPNFWSIRSSRDISSDSTGGIACWFIYTDCNGECFFVRHAYFLGARDPYKALKTTLKAEINREAWETLRSDTSRPFEKPTSGRIAVKVINHLGDEVMKVFRVK